MRKQKHTVYTHCPVEVVFDMIAGKWKSMVLFNLSEKTLRFNELMRLLPSITQRMLTTQLRELERDGLVAREVFAEVPPRVEYSMTPLGASLGPLLGTLKAWAETHVPERLAKTVAGKP
ncbi:MAG: helix-turn-helix domain-containing protein [Rhizobacter sp.]